MTSPAVETVRSIPLIIEKGNIENHIPMEEDDISGFPFDRDTNRDGHFRSQLDDIAKRHPELAEHLGSFSRRRQSSGGDAEDFHRRFERPFGSGHFERFGFPFDRDSFDPEQYAQQFYEQKPEHHHPQQQSYQSHQQQHPQNYQHQQSYPPQYQPPHEYQEPQQSQQHYSPPDSTDAPSASESGKNNIQQSNTIDLGQKQEPVNERNQRSMSAPPTEKGQRFTSSINIPVNQPTEGENMAQTQAQQGDAKTTERIIPIHIEGRDEPVLPKTASSTYYQPQSAEPQPERIFGQRPEHFTQYVNREPKHFDKWHRPGFDQMHQGFVPEEVHRQQRYSQQNVPPYYQQQQQQRPAPQPHQQHVPPQPQPKEEIPIPVQREVPLTKQQAHPQQQAAPPQQPKPAPQQQKPQTPIDKIQEIQKDVSDLMVQVEKFSGKPKDKQYLYLDEMLTRNLLKLDDIDTQGQDSIRSARKEAIKCIEKAISVLEAIAEENVKPKTEEKMEVEEKPQEPPKENVEGENAPQTEVQTMETEQATEAVPESKIDEHQPQPMELSPENPVKDEVVSEEKKEVLEDKQESVTENPQPVVENRAVLVTSEDKEVPKTEDKVESVEMKEPPAVEQQTAEDAKPVQTETCEGQESNLPVAEAIKQFEAKEKGEEAKSEDKDSVQVQEDKSVDNKKEEKKEKKKGKKKAEKKEK